MAVHPSFALSHDVSFSRQLQTSLYRKALKHVRTSLSPRQKFASYVVHQPLLEKAAEIMAKTIVNGWGLMGAGTVSLLGSLLYSVTSLYYDYEYNPMMFVLLLAAGFVLGILCQFFLKLRDW